jgi:tetratricopeptide (TPR) repeat protein
MAGSKRGLAAAMALGAALYVCATARAQAAPVAAIAQPIPEISLGAGALADPDADPTRAAADDADTHGILTVKGHEAQLRQVLAHMPNPFVRTRTEGGQLIYRADSARDCQAYAAAHASENVACQGNPYASAGFYLGSYYNEIGQSEQALVVLDQGLLAGPDSPILIAERNAALTVLHRWAEMLAAADRGLAIVNLSDAYRALMLRNRGYALVALGRLDEGQQAYEASLALVPDNALAKNELKYIAGLRAGSAPTEGTLELPNKPKSN